MIKFSVIITNYNHAIYLKERIDSILTQTYQNFELIIIDDLSTDNSREIIEEYRYHPKVSHIYYASKNSGSPFGQWQYAMEVASNDWIWIAESDDVAEPNFLEEAEKEITKYEKAGLYFSNSMIERNGLPTLTTSDLSSEILKSQVWEKSYSINGIEEINKSIKFHSLILNVSAVVFKKDLLKNDISDLKSFKYFGDWYAYIQILSRSTLIYNHKLLNRFRRTEVSHSQLISAKNNIDIKQECFRILHSLLKNPGVENKKELIAWFIKKYIDFGIKTDGLKKLPRLVKHFYSINFLLATKVLGKIFLRKMLPK